MRLELPPQMKLVHETVIPIRWGDMDAMGHVNNTIHFRYMETARLEWIYQACGAGSMSSEGPLMVNGFCNYRRQLEHPGDVLVKTFVANPGRSSFDSFHTIARTDLPGEIWADGGATLVWTDHAAKKSAPMPDWFRALLV